MSNCQHKFFLDNVQIFYKYCVDAMLQSCWKLAKYARLTCRFVCKQLIDMNSMPGRHSPRLLVSVQKTFYKILIIKHSHFLFVSNILTSSVICKLLTQIKSMSFFFLHTLSSKQFTFFVTFFRSKYLCFTFFVLGLYI